jgi:hypothetical protein
VEDALISQWNADLLRLLDRLKTGSDRSDAIFLANVERETVSFLDHTILGNLSTFFPGASPRTVSGAFVSKHREFRIAAIGRYVQDTASLQITINQVGQPRQEHRPAIKITGFPPVSGLNNCMVFHPPGLSVNAELLKELISVTYKVAYDRAVEVFRKLVRRRFDDAGSPFYEALRPHISHLPVKVRGRVLFTIYYKDTEYPLLSGDIVQGFVDSIDKRVGKVARQNITEFARFFISSVQDNQSPFREMAETDRYVICELEQPDASFYNSNVDFNQFMKSIYQRHVALYPVSRRDNIILAVNAHPDDLAVLSPILDAKRSVFDGLLDRNHRNIVSSLKGIENLKKLLEKKPNPLFLDASIFALANLPDIVESGKSIFDAGTAFFT